MRRARLHLVTLACAVGLLAPAPSALAAPPRNDNYLSSLRMVDRSGERVARSFRDRVDTTEATTQPDLFDPSADGSVFGGGPPEDTSCGSVVYGKTVWYDFKPEVFGGVQIVAGGFDTVVRVYEWNERTSLITRTVHCQDEGTAVEEVLLPEVGAGTAYTVQVAGRGAGDQAASGPLDFRFSFFPDRDRDTVLDAQDRCDDQRGVLSSGGCPPALTPNARVAFANADGGVELTRLEVEQLPAGARVEARCRSCGLRQAKRVRGRRVSLDRFVGEFLPAGARLELFSTRPASGSGRFRFGAIGSYLRFDIRDDSLGQRTVRCLRPGSLKPRRRCTP